MLVTSEARLAQLVEDDLETLMHDHWQECSIDKDEVPFAPDWLMAYTMERVGILRCYAAYREGELVGYAIFEVSTDLHFKTTKFAFNSGIYIKPEHRGFAGGCLTAFAEDKLKALGCKKIVYQAPHGSALGGVLERAGFKPSEIYYTKLVS